MISLNLSLYSALSYALLYFLDLIRPISRDGNFIVVDGYRVREIEDSNPNFRLINVSLQRFFGAAALTP